MRTLVAAVFAGGALAGPAAADSAGAAVRLEYTAPAACPDAISVRAGVIARLGYDPFADAAARVLVVKVEAGSAGYATAIDVVDGGAAAGSRRLPQTAGCDEAVAALELALAIAIDPRFGAPPPPVDPPPAADPPPVVAPPPPEGRFQPPRPPPASLRSDIGFVVGGLATAFPGVITTFGLDLGYRLAPRWRVGVGARFGRGEGELDASRTFDGAIVEVRGEACFVRSVVLACGVGGVGTKSVQIDRDDGMFVITTVYDGRRVYGVLGARVAVAIPLGSQGIGIASADADLVLPPVDLASEGVVRHDASAVELGFSFGLGYRW